MEAVVPVVVIVFGVVVGGGTGAVMENNIQAFNTLNENTINTHTHYDN